MILQALCDYYDLLVKEKPTEVAKYGYAVTSVSKCIVIDQEGNLVQVMNRMQEQKLVNKKGKEEVKLVPERIITPLQPKRSGKQPQAAFLCDNINFIFGIYKDSEGAEHRFKSSGLLHYDVLANVDDEGGKAIVAFFQKRTKGSIDYGDVDTSSLNEGGNIVFMLLGDSDFIHNRPKIKTAWDTYRIQKQDNTSIGQCLVTGDKGPIARIHGNLDGFGQDKPTLVGFNKPSFVSYNKEQGDNAPISEEAAFKYVTALNMLIADRRHSRTIYGEKILFWAARALPLEENAIALLLGGGSSEPEVERDETTSQRLASVMQHLYQGTSPEELDLSVNTRIFLLSVSTNKTRLVVRNFYVDSVGNVIQRLQQHHADIYIEGLQGEKEHPSLFDILIETAVRHDSKNVPAPYQSSLVRTIMTNSLYPNSLYMAMLGRIRAESCGDAKAAINRTRIGIIKGYLNRLARESGKKEWIGVNLEETKTKPEKTLAYTLGQIFAILNQAQHQALSFKVNASVVDKYLNTALASPGQVFPSLISNAQHHFSKLAKDGKTYMEKLLGEVMADVPVSGFPQTLNAEGQGQFLVGFYHQQQEFYKKKESNLDKADGKQEIPNINIEDEK